MFPTLPRSAIPTVTPEQMAEADRLMIEVYGVGVARMMENAGFGVAELARLRFLDGKPEAKRVVLLAGSGGNGGDALVASRRLANWGANIRVALAQPADTMKGAAAEQLAILQAMNTPISETPPPYDFASDLIVDGLLGFSLSGAPRGGPKRLIEWANAQQSPILAIDTPSGFDAGSGHAHQPSITATATLTLALPKPGLIAPEAKAPVGELYCADISVPPQLYSKASIGLDAPTGIFAKGPIVRIE